MKLSYNWLKEYIDIDLSVEELSETLTMLGMEVEEIINSGEELEGFVTAEVLQCDPHPDADKLSVCRVSDGSEEYLVVCGAPNVATGQKVALGKVGATVPAAGFTLEKRKLRGVVSEGMICSQSELNLGLDSGGIWELPQDTPLGLPLAEYAGVKDVVFDIFLTPNKADCNSHIGIARDLAAYLRKDLKYPLSFLKEGETDINDLVAVTVVDKTNCPRYAGRMVQNVKIVESPDWLKHRLLAVGLRPLNAPADITNFVLMEYGQPLHAFDYDKIAGKSIVVKSAREGAKFTTLDGKERKLSSDMLMICDAEKEIAVAGVMGGAETEITESTQNIFLESAFFNMSSVRKTSRKLALQSDASYRFERGVDYAAVTEALDRAAVLIQEICGGEIARGTIDVYPDEIEKQQVRLRFDRVRDILGEPVSDNEIKDILRRLKFDVRETSDESYVYSVPTWRVDVRGEIDLIEEVARIYNYDNITPDFSGQIDFSGRHIVDEYAVHPLKERLATHMADNGFSEIMTLNMISPKDAEYYCDNPVKIANPLGEDLSIMRPSPVPSMLKIVNHNIRMGNSDLRLFEQGKVFRKVDPREDTCIKGYREPDKLIIVMTGNAAPIGWDNKPRPVDFYDLKGVVENLGDFYRIGDKQKFKQPDEPKPGFSKNTVCFYNGKQYIGVLGEVDKKLLDKYDIEQPVMMAVIDLEQIYALAQKEVTYTPVSPFPTGTRDLAFLCDKSVELGAMIAEIKNKGGKLLKNTFLFDIYDGKGIPEGKKSAAFGLEFGADDRTLKEKEVEKAVAKIVAAIEKKFSAELRS